MDLTVEEINMLIEAVSAWIDADENKTILASLISGAMMVGQDNIGVEKARDYVNEAAQGARVAKRAREEQGTMLKAKLLTMRNKAEVREVAQSLKE
jgi:hypothetical protein